MLLIPAIDILGGKVVRLRKGRYDEVTVYADDPLEPARRFVDGGCTWLHVVDLDGARDGAPTNLATVEQLAGLPLKVQVGGGVRSPETAQRLYQAGAERVVLGTTAVRDPDFVQRLASQHPVVVAADGKHGMVAVEGWLEETSMSVGALVQSAASWGAQAVLYTNIERDGMKSGPDVEGTAGLQQKTEVDVIASGGIATLDDLVALDNAGVRACVSGRALLDGAFTVEAGVRAAAGAG